MAEEVDRRTILRRRWMVAGVGVALLAAGAAVGSLWSPILDVDSIEVVGSQVIASEEVIAASGLGLGDAMFGVDPSAAEGRLRRDPRIKRVSVSKEYPAHITVRVTDRRPVAVLAGPTATVVVAEGGVVLGTASGSEVLRRIEVTADPPTRPGAAIDPDVEAAVNFVSALSYDVAVRIDHVDITAADEIELILDDATVVLIGAVDDAERKLLALRTMLSAEYYPEDVCRLDLRVPSAVTAVQGEDCDPSSTDSSDPDADPDADSDVEADADEPQVDVEQDAEPDSEVDADSGTSNSDPSNSSNSSNSSDSSDSSDSGSSSSGSANSQ